MLTFRSKVTRSSFMPRKLFAVGTHNAEAKYCVAAVREALCLVPRSPNRLGPGLRIEGGAHQIRHLVGEVHHSLPSASASPPHRRWCALLVVVREQKGRPIGRTRMKSNQAKVGREPAIILFQNRLFSRVCTTLDYQVLVALPVAPNPVLRPLPDTPSSFTPFQPPASTHLRFARLLDKWVNCDPFPAHVRSVRPTKHQPSLQP